MAHPTITIVDEPSLVCPNADYNCVKYCFEATDFQTQVGTKATFDIELNIAVAGYAPGVEFTVAGQIYTTGTSNTYNEVNSAAPQTQAQFAVNMKAALDANNVIFSKYKVEIVGTKVVATAREVGEIEDFDFDYSNFVGTPPNNNDTNGTNNIYRDNYKLVIEVWQRIPSLSGYTEVKISSEAYTPDSNGEFCVNVGEKIAPLLKTRFLHDLILSTSCFDDMSIAGEFFIRYGDLYSDTFDDCDVVARTFDTSDTIIVFDAAFQREDQADKLQLVCEHQWMTNMPQYSRVCENTDVVMWMWLGALLPKPPDTIEIRPKFIITYTDGSTSTHTGAECLYNPVAPTNFKAIPVGKDQINFFANPLKVIDYYECMVQVLDTSIPASVDYGSQFFKWVSCCEGDVQFYFLNEFGGYDTILFSQIDAIELNQENAIFESFLDCDETDALRGGKEVVDTNAGDIYTVVSKFPYTYQSRLWLREFIASPRKYIRATIEGQDEIFSKVLLVENSVQYYLKDDNTFLLRLQYILNEDLNLIKN